MEALSAADSLETAGEGVDPDNEEDAGSDVVVWQPAESRNRRAQSVKRQILFMKKILSVTVQQNRPLSESYHISKKMSIVFTRRNHVRRINKLFEKIKKSS